MSLVERVHLWAKAAADPKLQALHMEMCRRDPIYWFNNFCWTFDPRKDQPNIPFHLYPFQEWFVKELKLCFEEQMDLGIEKSRDMGVTWMVILMMQWGWLFHEGWHFHVGSRKEQEVDTASDDASTLFGKFRYNLYRLPGWMRPKGVEKSDKKLLISNPINGNVFTGESANPSFGRGQRKRAILFDEFAFWDSAEMSYEGSSQTTNCRVLLSTPYGETNHYARLMLSEDNELIKYPGEKDCLIAKGIVNA